jgi:vitamin B12 transporter
VDANAFTFGDEVALSAQVVRELAGRLDFTAELKTYSWDGGSDDGPDDSADTLGYFGFQSLDAFRRTSADLRLAMDLGKGGGLSFGAELEKEKQRSFSQSLSEYGPSTGRSSFQRYNRGVYGHLVSQGKRWSGHAGARLEANEQYGTFVTYQTGASYRIESTGTRLRGTVGRGLKEPTFLETSATGYTVGNPDLDPERSLAVEAGLDQSLGAGGTSVAVTWFRQTLEDLIQYTYLSPEPGGPNFFNVAEARTQGVEASLEVPMGPALVRAGYTPDTLTWTRR